MNKQELIKVWHESKAALYRAQARPIKDTHEINELRDYLDYISERIHASDKINPKGFKIGFGL